MTPSFLVELGIMKILHVITGLGTGGAEAVLVRLIKADQGKGNHHCVVSLMDRGVYAEQLEQCNVPVYALNCPRGRVGLGSLSKLFRIIRETRPDVVQTWMYHADLIGGLIARLAGVRSIVWGIRHANLDPAHNSSTTLRVVRLCANLSRWVPRKIVSCSAQATKLHQTVGYRADKFVQIYNGYSMERFRPDVVLRDSVRNELNIEKGVFILGMVARFDVQKNHQNLIEALGLLKQRGLEFVCLLVGARMENSNAVLKEWIEKANITQEVKLLGPRHDIPAIMNALDVHVLSSLGEAFPNVLAEAMACGTPCVTTNVGDAAVIVAKHGWVVGAQDSRTLADGVMQAYDGFAGDFSAWRERKQMCRAHIMENFELGKMREQYRQLWQSCIEK